MKEECKTWDGRQNEGKPFDCLLCDKLIESGETHGTQHCIEYLSDGWAKVGTENVALKQQVQSAEALVETLKASDKKNYHLYCDAIFERDRAREEVEKLKSSVSAAMNAGIQHAKESADAKLQVNDFKNALLEVCRMEGPGADGSPESGSGRIAREALERNGGDPVNQVEVCGATHPDGDKSCGKPLGHAGGCYPFKGA